MFTKIHINAIVQDTIHQPNITRLGATPLTYYLKNTKASHLKADTSSSCRLSEEGDDVGVSPERADVPVHPGDGGMLVPQTVVSCRNDTL